MKKDWAAYSNVYSWRERMNKMDGMKELTEEGLARYAAVAEN